MSGRLSHGQEALWHLHRMAPEGTAYTIAGAAKVVGTLDREALRRAFEAVVERHPAVRTVFPASSGEVRSRITEGSPTAWEEIDGSGWSEGDLSERIAAIVDRPFDLETGPLFRMGLVDRGLADDEGGEAEPILFLSMHHTVGDLWSLAVLLRDLGTAYGVLLERLEGIEGAEDRDPGAVLPPLATSWERWVEEEHERLEGPDGDRLRRLWHDHLGDVPAPLEMPADRNRPARQSFAGGQVSRPLGERSTRAGLRAVARDLGLGGPDGGPGHFALLIAAFETLLARHAGQDRFALGTPTSGRLQGGARNRSVEGVVGYFVEPVALVADLAGEPTFAELARRADAELAFALGHPGYPLPLLAEELVAERDPSRPPLVQAFIVFQKSPIRGMRDLPAFALGRGGVELHLGPLEVESLALPRRGSQLDLALFLTEEHGARAPLQATLEYDSALFDRETAADLLDRLAELLDAALEDPERAVADLPLATAAERRTILEEQAPGPALAADASRGLLHERVLAVARHDPEAEALVAGGMRWTRGELAAASGAAAAHLRALGVGPGVAVGVFLDRAGDGGADLVVALLATLEAGGFYVPLDPAYPEDRLRAIVEDSGTKLVLTSGELAARARTLGGGGGGGGEEGGSIRPVTVAEARIAGEAARDDARDDARHVAPSPDDLAYLIYTSGSTGRPKGVAISHANVSALVSWAVGVYEPAELAGVLASTSICFDLSVFEIFVPLATPGGRVILAEDALALPRLPARDEVTLINTVPSAMTRLVEDAALPPFLRTVNLAGEPLRGDLVAAIHRASAASSASGRPVRVVNLYGPSEDTTYSTIAECAECSECAVDGGSASSGASGTGPAEEPTIGRAIGGGAAYVVDARLRLLPPGVPGELVLGGAGVARGYLGRSAATAERYVPDPFAGLSGDGPRPGARLYRTGDRARFLPRGARRGELDFLGRLDHQVKVRGFRIELGEVESVVRSHPSVADAVVTVRGEGPAANLAAYVIGATAAGGPDVETLRSFVATKLPASMVPSTFTPLDALPVTPNGKVDRKALPDPFETDGTTAGGRSTEYVEPETDIEMALVAIWSEVLGVERIGVEDRFFELGGNSLQAGRILLRVRDLFGVDVPVEALFDRPTITGLTTAIAEALIASVGMDE